MRGYGFRNCFQKGLEDDIELGVMAFQQGKHTQLIITDDCEGIQLEYCRKIYAEVEKKFGITYPDIYISSSHTHFAPGFSPYTVSFPGGELPMGIYPEDKRFFDFWVRKLLPTIQKALDSIEEGSLEQVNISVSGIAFNRRTVRKDNGLVDTNYRYPQKNADDYNFSPIDHNFDVWRFMVQNKPKAIVGCFACHPVTGGKDDYSISADYPGAFKRAIQEKFNCPGFFMLGAAGDVVPMRRNGTSRQDIGEVLSAAIRLNELKFQKVSAFRLESKTYDVSVKISDKYDRANYLENWNKELEIAKTNELFYEPLFNASYPIYMFTRWEQNEFDLPIQLMRMGDKILVGIPFEVLSVIALRLKKIYPNVVLTSITGGYESYLSLAEDFPKGGYEATTGANYMPDTGDRMLAAAIKAIKEFA